MPLRLLGYFPYIPLGRTINMSELDKELQTWNVAFELTLKVTKKEQADADLTARGYQFHGLKLAAKRQLLRQDIIEKEETTNGECEVDMTRYFTSCCRRMSARQSLRKNREYRTRNSIQ
jgi:hypothetical protein